VIILIISLIEKNKYVILTGDRANAMFAHEIEQTDIIQFLIDINIVFIKYGIKIHQ
jgi:hypothetical protein